VNDHHVEIRVGAGLLLRIELLEDLLRSAVARPGADGHDLHTRVALLEEWPEIILDVIDHVLVAGSRDVERLRTRRTAHQKGCESRSQ
jgi:hypothetical protein